MIRTEFETQKVGKSYDLVLKTGSYRRPIFLGRFKHEDQLRAVQGPLQDFLKELQTKPTPPLTFFQKAKKWVKSLTY